MWTYKSLLLLGLMLVVVTACQGTQAETQAGSPSPTALPAPEETVTPVALGESIENGKETGDQLPLPECTIVSRRPTPGPTLQSLFPAPGESDWARGPSTARVTIIEYSDFQ